MLLHHSPNHQRVTAPVASRRTVVRGALAFTGIVALGLRGASAHQATPAPADIPDGETFVALADDGQTHVAVVIAPGEPGSDREARFYLCDGQTHSIWLTGATDGDALELSNETAQMRATLAAGGVTGEATLPDGAALTFDATRAEGVAGFYEVIVDDGRLEGRGGDGQRLQGVIAGTLSDGRLVVAAVVALANDTAQAVAAIATSDLQGASRWIVLPGGKPVGGPKGSEGSGFIGQNIGLAVPEEGDFVIGQSLGL